MLYTTYQFLQIREFSFFRVVDYLQQKLIQSYNRWI